MVSVLQVICWMSLVYSIVNGCTQYRVLMTVDEPGSLCCVLPSEQSNSVTWYRNGSSIPITSNNDSRIHQQGRFLWFIPASMEDSGVYECSINGSVRKARKLEIFQNQKDSCFNQNTIFSASVPLNSNGKMTCPIENNFGNPNALQHLQWYRGCSHRLHNDDEKYHSLDNYLIIKQAAKEDEGMYLCQAQFTYMGKQYNVSRAIELTLFVSYPNIPPNITYPRNNSFEADLGSSVLMDCNVSTYTEDLLVYWMVNGTYLQDFNSMYNVDNYMIHLPNKWIIGAKFNISKVKNEDYMKFTCVANSLKFYSSAYIVLNRPARNIQSYLIGGLVPPLFVILASMLTYKFFKVDIVLWYRGSFLRKAVSDGKLYDAYVLYPKNATNCLYSTDIFVLKVLPDVLEKQCGYNLFIFGRDDLPGHAEVNIVDETIKQSRRVIIVLLPDSSCCSTRTDASEQHIAVYHALVQDGIKVILIELDKIKDYTNMPESIKYLKQKHGVLTWRGDFSEKSQMATSRFWKNVRYQMPPSQSPPSPNLHLLPVFIKSAPVSDG